MTLQQHRPICLASSSPRRKELLARYGLTFSLQSPDIDESVHPTESVVDYVCRLAQSKASAIDNIPTETLILAADTTVFCEKSILGKPENHEDAKGMLLKLNGTLHQVYTGYAIRDVTFDTLLVGWECTVVQFREVPGSWIDWYVKTGEPMGKAGSYSIQGLGSLLVEKIDGSYSNVMGLPVETILWEMMQQQWITV